MPSSRVALLLPCSDLISLTSGLWQNSSPLAAVSPSGTGRTFHSLFRPTILGPPSFLVYPIPFFLK